MKASLLRKTFCTTRYDTTPSATPVVHLPLPSRVQCFLKARGHVHRGILYVDNHLLKEKKNCTISF